MMRRFIIISECHLLSARYTFQSLPKRLSFQKVLVNWASDLSNDLFLFRGTIIRVGRKKREEQMWEIRWIFATVPTFNSAIFDVETLQHCLDGRALGQMATFLQRLKLSNNDAKYSPCIVRPFSK